jgi:hypothetical protein
MKQAKPGRKLTLSKKTVAQLQTSAMIVYNGGKTSKDEVCSPNTINDASCPGHSCVTCNCTSVTKDNTCQSALVCRRTAA